MENEVLTFLTYGPDHTVHLLLPYGDFLVGADIKDKEGATTRINMTRIAVREYAIQIFESRSHLRESFIRKKVRITQTSQ